MQFVMNFNAIMQVARDGGFCDCGHYYCPRMRTDGALVFPSGILHPDGTFNGAKRLGAELENLSNYQRAREPGKWFAAGEHPMISFPPPACPAEGGFVA
jgi:hypothetical protein